MTETRRVIQAETRQIAVDSDETFEQYADRIYRTRLPIQYKDGTPIEVTPGERYTLPIDLTPPTIPARFAESEREVKMYLCGDLYFEIRQVDAPPPEQENTP